MQRDLLVPSFPLENSLCILNLTVPSSFASGVVVLDVVSCIATTHSNSVGGVSGGYTHCSSAYNPHCLYTKNDKGYVGMGCINLACTRIKAARVVVITAVTDYAT